MPKDSPTNGSTFHPKGGGKQSPKGLTPATVGPPAYNYD
jgi:hypothetical protein